MANAGIPYDEESTSAGNRAPDLRPPGPGMGGARGPSGTHVAPGAAGDAGDGTMGNEERTFHGTRQAMPTRPDVVPGGMSGAGIGGMSAAGKGGPPPPPPPPPVQRTAPPRPSGRTRSPGDDERPALPVVGEQLSTFRVEGELGRGAMGVVMQVTDDRLRRRLALKVLLRPDDHRAATRFVEEAQITGQLEHPNIVPVHELGTDADGRPWLAMKEVHGQTLRQWIEERRDQPTPVTAEDLGWMVDVISRICDGMSFAHWRGVLHRDLKPDNVMLGDFGEVLVMDWGLARAAGSPEEMMRAPMPPVDVGSMVRTDRRESGSMLTVDGDVCGTPAFMAPEQANGKISQLCDATDIFAIGGILYAMLTLDAPYRGKSVVEVLAKASRRTLPSPHKRAPHRHIPRELDAIVEKAMAYNPDARYVDCAALKRDLQAYRNHEPITALRDGPAHRLIKAARRHPAAAIGMSLTAIFAAVIVTVAGLLLAQADFAEQEARIAKQESEQASQRERQANLETLARDGRIEDLVAALGGTLLTQRDEVVSEFLRRTNEAIDAGGTVEGFIEGLGDERRRFISAFEKLLAAHDRFGDAIPVEPTDYFYLGILYLNSDRAEDAIDMYLRALAINRDLAGVWHNLGTARETIGDQQGALEAYNEALRIEPEYFGAAMNRANVLRGLGRVRESLAEIDKLLRRDPGNWKLLANRGACHHRLGNAQQALDDFNAALETNPESSAALYNRGNLKRTTGDHDGAIADYTASIEIDPTFADAWFNRGVSRQATGDIAAALADYERTLELNDKAANVWSNRGLARRLLGDNAGARADFDRAIQLDPDSATALHNRGNLRIETGDLVGGLTDIERAIRGEPTKWELHVNKGMALARLGRRDDAKQAFADARRRAPEARRAVVDQFEQRELGN